MLRDSFTSHLCSPPSTKSSRIGSPWSRCYWSAFPVICWSLLSSFVHQQFCLVALWLESAFLKIMQCFCLVEGDPKQFWRCSATTVSDAAGAGWHQPSIQNLPLAITPSEPGSKYTTARKTSDYQVALAPVAEKKGYQAAVCLVITPLASSTGVVLAITVYHCQEASGYPVVFYKIKVASHLQPANWTEPIGQGNDLNHTKLPLVW